MSRFDRRDRRLFDDVADDYHAARPSYPDALIRRLTETAGLTQTSRVLEIGCGTGKFTALLAQHGCHITGIELGARLASVARQAMLSLPNVEIVTGNFETWETDGTALDLVVSAQAFHWIDPAIGYPKARALLKPTGHLALVWNLFPGGDGPLYAALDRVYRTHAPMLCGGHQESLVERVDRTTREIATSGCFDPPVIHRVPWTSTYSAEEYIRLLATFSDHRALEPSVRKNLLSRIQATIEQWGGRIDRPWISTLFLSQTR